MNQIVMLWTNWTTTKKFNFINTFFSKAIFDELQTNSLTRHYLPKTCVQIILWNESLSRPQSEVIDGSGFKYL